MLFEYQTERLILRILKPDSAGQVLSFYIRDKELFESTEPDRAANFYTIPHQQKILKCEYDLAVRLSTIRFYVFEKTDPQTIIGTVCFHQLQKAPCFRTCEIGYKFSSAVHHRGYAAEAITMGLWVMFRDIRLHSVRAWVLPDNEASIRLLTRLGFHRDGLIRDHLYLQGCWRDNIEFSMLENEFKG